MVILVATLAKISGDPIISVVITFFHFGMTESLRNVFFEAASARTLTSCLTVASEILREKKPAIKMHDVLIMVGSSATPARV